MTTQTIQQIHKMFNEDIHPLGSSYQIIADRLGITKEEVINALRAHCQIQLDSSRR